MNIQADPEIKEKIYCALRYSDCNNRIDRVTLSEVVGLNERMLRLFISLFCPDIGGHDGYWLCRTKEDWRRKNADTLKRIKSLCLRYRQSRKAQADQEQEQIKFRHQELVEKGECPEFLRRAFT